MFRHIIRSASQTTSTTSSCFISVPFVRVPPFSRDFSARPFMASALPTKWKIAAPFMFSLRMDSRTLSRPSGSVITASRCGTPCRLTLGSQCSRLELTQFSSVSHRSYAVPGEHDRYTCLCTHYSVRRTTYFSWCVCCISCASQCLMLQLQHMFSLHRRKQGRTLPSRVP